MRSRAGSRSRSCARCRSRPLRVEAEVVRPGASRGAARGELRDGDGERDARPRLAARASADELELAGRPARAPAPPRPGLAAGRARERRSSTTGQDVGYHTRWSTGSSRRLRRARPGDRLDADAPAAGRRRGAVAAAAGARRRRLGQRGQRDARLAPLPVHQRRPHASTCTACRRASGSASTRSRSRSRPASGSPTRRCTTSAGRSAGRSRRCSSRALSLRLAAL